MATPFIASAFVSGEISPALWGRIDVERERVAATTMRNSYVNYRGGAASRAGLAFVGFSKQTGRSIPPRLIPFQFSIDQGIGLEFGNFYVRFMLDGAYVTENPVAIGGATNADPAVLTFGTEGAATATPINTGVTFSYAPGDLISLAGGSALAEAVLQVTTSQLVSILPNNPGTGYAVNDTVTLGGGTSSVSAVAKVATVAAYAAHGTITFTTNPNDGDTVTLNGVVWTFKTSPTTAAQTQIQTTLSGTLSQLANDLNASANASLTPATYSSNLTQLVITYDTTGTGGNAYTLAASVATPSAGTLLGGTTTGIATLTINTAGIFSALPVNALMTQAATSGGGTGASFQTAVFGPHALTISNPGAYNTVPANPVSQDTTTGIGQGATFTMTWAAVAAFNNGDWVFVSGVQGMTQLNGNTYQLASVTATTAALLDVYGNAVDSTHFGAYTGSGEVARIYTVTTQYAEADLKWIKYSQSADVMSLCCVNQDTGTEYPPQDLSRFSDTDWQFSDVVTEPTVNPPATTNATISGSGSTYYQYVITAVSPIDGSESVASNIAGIEGVSISTQQGQVNLTWSQVADVTQYNVYKAQPSYGSPVPAGSLFGYLGSAFGTGFQDSNIFPDFSQTPPHHQNPFARGQVVGANVVTGGSGYSSAAVATINTSTGSGGQIATVILNGALVALIVEDPGEGYAPGDTITISGGGGHGATATLVVGAQSGTYPGVVSYFQERRAYANTLNQTDTYFMSQPGAFTNFDTRIPPIDTDAVTGSPWSVQVNGIQWMVQTSGGLLVMTGLSAWLLVGAGSFATNVASFSPSSQDDVPQAFSGVSPNVPPIKINYDVIYVNANGSYYYALPYQLYVLSEPIDITELSGHLFTGYQILENAWCEQPSKLLWAIRNDGVMLSLTYYKSQQVAGWARHDTNGFFVSCCSIRETPVDALYVATQRFINGNNAYMVERMNNRMWRSVEDVWAVDAALSLTQPTPNATLNASAANGLGALTGATIISGGAGYSAATTISIVDDNGKGPGTGAAAVPVIVAGVITAINFTSLGSNYVNPRIVIQDPAHGGTGAAAHATLDTTVTFTASAAIFDGGDIGSVIRMGGGIADIQQVPADNIAVATLRTPITALLPNSGGAVAPQTPGNWTMTSPVTEIFGLEHLAGATVTGLADGNVITPRQVGADGTVTLDAAASAVTIGLGFQAQLQGVYFEGGGPTVQGQRKKTAAASILLEASRGVKVGGAQPDGSKFSPPQITPQWNNLKTLPDKGKPAYNSNVIPLYTGYSRAPVIAGFDITGQISLQQDNPLPMNVSAVVGEYLEGDTPDQEDHGPAKQRQQQAA